MFAAPRRLPALLLSLSVSLAFALPQSAQAPPGYYDTVDDSSGAALRNTLHPVVDDHTRFPYTAGSTDTWNILEQADEDPTNSGRIITIYRNAVYNKVGGGNSNYNREHIWPSSLGFPDDGPTNYPFTDCHMLHLANEGYNSSRSNKPYGACNSGCAEFPTDVNAGMGGGTGVYPGNSNWTSGSFTTGTWEVWTGRRGDIARSMFYADIRYEGGTHNVTGVTEPNLHLTDDLGLIVASQTGNNESEAYMGRLAVLLQWHAADPVDTFEMDRNDAVFGFQGNRNPFVDHPEWVDILYGTTGVPPATEPWINELHYDNIGNDVGEFVEIAGPTNTDLTGWSLYAYDGAVGTTYANIPLSGTIPNQSGCYGTLSFTFSGLQNGGADGLALVDDVGDVIQFLSYEGTLTALDGPAVGLLSTEITTSENGSTPVGHSLQLGGDGDNPVEFFWQSPMLDTPGTFNSGQTVPVASTPGLVASRNAGGNQPSFLIPNAPVIGQNMIASVDLAGTSGHTSAVIFGFDSPVQIGFSGGQILLCLDLLGAGELLQAPVVNGPVANFNIPVPNDGCLAGFSFCTQAIHFGGVVPFELSNSQDLTIGAP